MAGLFAANIFFREGWDVALYERVYEDLEGRGAGIATHEELFRAMKKAGAKVDEDIGIAIKGRTAYDLAGRQICHFAYSQYLTSWALLYRRLRAALPDHIYHAGRNVADISDDDCAASVVFSDMSSDTADLVIGADGIWSTVRAKCNPHDAPQYAGYVAWRGLVAESRLADAIREKHGHIQGFYTTHSEQLVHFAVPGIDDSVEAGRRRFSFLWYRPYEESSELADLLTDVDGNQHRYSISPGKIHPKHIEKLRNDAAQLLPPDFAATVCMATNPFVQPIYDLVCERIAFRRVVLVGDAAFVARPHVGAGVTKAGTDVVVLTDALRKNLNLSKALEEFQLERSRFGRAIVERGRYLGGYLGSSTSCTALSPEELIREVAKPLVMT